MTRLPAFHPGGPQCDTLWHYSHPTHSHPCHGSRDGAARRGHWQTDGGEV